MAPLLKEMNFLAVIGMVVNRQVAALEFHIAMLPVAKVAIRVRVDPAILIPVSWTILARGKQKDIREFGWRANTTLFLTTEFCMDVISAMIFSPDIEHTLPPPPLLLEILAVAVAIVPHTANVDAIGPITFYDSARYLPDEKSTAYSIEPFRLEGQLGRMNPIDALTFLE